MLPITAKNSTCPCYQQLHGIKCMASLAHDIGDVQYDRRDTALHYRPDDDLELTMSRQLTIMPGKATSPAQR